jgi:hypothetical protein
MHLCDKNNNFSKTAFGLTILSDNQTAKGVMGKYFLTRESVLGTI